MGTEYSGYILSSGTSQKISANPCIFCAKGSTITVIVGSSDTRDIRVTYNAGVIKLVQSSSDTNSYHIVCLKLE